MTLRFLHPVPSYDDDGGLTDYHCPRCDTVMRKVAFVVRGGTPHPSDSLICPRCLYQYEGPHERRPLPPLAEG